MGHDDYDETPGDADAEDFANFDPERYGRRRNSDDLDRSSYNDPQPSAPSEDFTNFDPNAYLRKRRGETGRSLIGQDASADRAYRRHRGFGSDDEDDALPDAGAAAGLGLGLLGGILSGGQGNQYFDILRRTSPLVRAGLLALGCGVLTLIGMGCVIGYLLVTALSKR